MAGYRSCQAVCGETGKRSPTELHDLLRCRLVVHVEALTKLTRLTGVRSSDNRVYEWDHRQVWVHKSGRLWL